MALEGGPEVPGEIPQYCMRNVPKGTESVTDDDDDSMADFLL